MLLCGVGVNILGGSFKGFVLFIGGTSTIKLASNTNCEAVLLSPACASFDMFDNFEHRGGRVLKDCVNHLEV
ncbi:UDP-N-acetylmuramoylalanine--D-glutamate ligase [uncultured Candidatus Thioglobus sp.]|nr:UDP-N-acetylmuramoylalanine--D-glutamate ligase [uncultured Candidatus Thioglobus sp.]